MGKAQSAMEYLMTYGWAILIIAVVLGALYYLGIFNSATTAPRAQPGSCKVVRPSGPGTTTFVNLAGVCTGQLPMFVSSFTGVNSLGSGGAYIDAGNSGLLDMKTNDFTISLWVNLPSALACAGTCTVVGHGSQGNIGYKFQISAADKLVPTLTDINSNVWTQQNTNAIAAGAWAQIAIIVFRSTNIVNYYINGVLDYSSSTTLSTNSISNPSTHLYIGTAQAPAFRSYNGLISNVQIYNTSLSAIEMQGLYVEGIGGAPTRPQNLVGWWPLNGDSNDYSGNGNNGASTNVIFTNTWTR